MTVTSYRDLEVWRLAVDLAVKMYRITDGFPKSELYGLTSQMRRAAVSIASNIAEGHGRSDADFGRYLRIGLGSLAEIETQIEIAHRIGFLSSAHQKELADDCDHIGRKLRMLLKRVVPASG